MQPNKSNDLQNTPHLMCIVSPALQFSVLQVITTTPQFTDASAAQWGRIRQSLDRIIVFPAPGTPPRISMVPQVSRSARVRMKITVFVFTFLKHELETNLFCLCTSRQAMWW